MQREATQENKEQWDPAEVLQEGGDEVLFTSSIANDGERDVAQCCEDVDNRHVDPKAVEIVVVEFPI